MAVVAEESCGEVSVWWVSQTSADVESTIQLLVVSRDREDVAMMLLHCYGTESQSVVFVFAYTI